LISAISGSGSCGVWLADAMAERSGSRRRGSPVRVSSFLHSGASLLDHGVFEIEMDLFRCLGDFGIVRGVNGS